MFTFQIILFTPLSCSFAGITHVLNCAFGPNYYEMEEKFKYLNVKIHDVDEEALAPVLGTWKAQSL